MRLPAVLASLVLIGATVACGEQDHNATAPRDDAQPGLVPAGDAVESLHLFAERFGDLTAGEENTVYSPLSLAYAFGMLRAGAEGETAAQLDEVFRFPADGLHEQLGALATGIATTGEPPPVSEDDEEQADPVLAIANGLFVQHGAALGEDFLRTLADHYDAAAEEVDFTSGQAEQTINAWVAEQTADRIEKLFDQLDEDSVAVLANAVYLKAQWQLPFAEGGEEEFRLTGGGTVEVPMMNHHAVELAYVDGDGWHAVGLPYVGDDLVMWVLVPDEKDAPAPALTAATLAELAGGRSTPMNVTMPRWDFGTDFELLPILAEAGLTNLGELPGIAPDFFVTDAVHRANITVDEAGTEAAAATGIVGTTSLGPEPEIDFRADQPFSFAIMHTPTHVPLFLGTVADPTQG